MDRCVADLSWGVLLTSCGRRRHVIRRRRCDDSLGDARRRRCQRAERHVKAPGDPAPAAEQEDEVLDELADTGAPIRPIGEVLRGDPAAVLARFREQS